MRFFQLALFLAIPLLSAAIPIDKYTKFSRETIDGHYEGYRARMDHAAFVRIPLEHRTPEQIEAVKLWERLKKTKYFDGSTDLKVLNLLQKAGHFKGLNL